MEVPKMIASYEWDKQYSVYMEDYVISPDSGLLLCNIRAPNTSGLPNTTYVYLVDCSSTESWPILASVAEALALNTDPQEKRKYFITYSNYTKAYDKIVDFRAHIPGSYDKSGDCDVNFFELFRTIKMYFESAREHKNENTVFVHLVATEKAAPHKEFDDMFEALLKEFSGSNNFSMFTIIFASKEGSCPIMNVYQIMHQFCPPNNNIYYICPELPDYDKFRAVWDANDRAPITDAARTLLGPVYETLVSPETFNNRAQISFKSRFSSISGGPNSHSMEMEMEMQKIGQDEYMFIVPYVPSKQKLERVEFMPRLLLNNELLTSCGINISGQTTGPARFTEIINNTPFITSYTAIYVYWFFSLQLFTKNDKIQLVEIYNACKALKGNIVKDDNLKLSTLTDAFGQKILDTIHTIINRDAKQSNIAELLNMCAFMKDMGAIIAREVFARPRPTIELAQN